MKAVVKTQDSLCCPESGFLWEHRTAPNPVSALTSHCSLSIIHSSLLCAECNIDSHGEIGARQTKDTFLCFGWHLPCHGDALRLWVKPGREREREQEKGGIVRALAEGGVQERRESGVLGGEGWPCSGISQLWLLTLFWVRYTYGKPILGALQVSVCQKPHNYWFGEAEQKQLPDKCRNLTGQVSEWLVEKVSCSHTLKSKKVSKGQHGKAVQSPEQKAFHTIITQFQRPKESFLS